MTTTYCCTIKIKLFNFYPSLHSLLILFIRTYTVSYSLNIILFNSKNGNNSWLLPGYGSAREMRNFCPPNVIQANWLITGDELSRACVVKDKIIVWYKSERIALQSKKELYCIIQKTRIFAFLLFMYVRHKVISLLKYHCYHFSRRRVVAFSLTL